MADLVKVKNSISKKLASVESVRTQTVMDGGQIEVHFSNGYGASVVSHFGAYGNYEVAVLEEVEDAWPITYDTPVTSDVVPCSDKEDVFDILEQIANL